MHGSKPYLSPWPLLYTVLYELNGLSSDGQRYSKYTDFNIKFRKYLGDCLRTPLCVARRFKLEQFIWDKGLNRRWSAYVCLEFNTVWSTQLWERGGSLFWIYSACARPYSTTPTLKPLASPLIHCTDFSIKFRKFTTEGNTQISILTIRVWPTSPLNSPLHNPHSETADFAAPHISEVNYTLLLIFKFRIIIKLVLFFYGFRGNVNSKKTPASFSELSRPNCTKFETDVGCSSAIQAFISNKLLQFETTGNTQSVASRKSCQNLIFWPLWNLGERSVNLWRRPASTVVRSLEIGPKKKKMDSNKI